MVMQRVRPVMAYNQGAVQMAAPAGSAQVNGSVGVQGSLGGTNSGAGVGTVLAVATVALLLFYVFTHSIQGSV